MILNFSLFSLCVSVGLAFLAPPHIASCSHTLQLHMMSDSPARDSRQERRARRQAALTEGMEANAGIKWEYGVDLPPEITRLKEPIYDMFLVERISSPPTTLSGIVLPPGPEGKDRRQLGVVVAVPSADYGLESEQGRVQPNDEVSQVKLGDTVFVKDVWGIGPKNIEVGERKFSFHKAAHITGVVKK